MHMNENKLKFVTVIAVVLIFVLVLVMVTLIAQKIQLNIKQKNLEEQLEKLEQIKEEIGEETIDGEYRMTKEQIEKYLREQQGMIDAGETIWQPAN